MSVLSNEIGESNGPEVSAEEFERVERALIDSAARAPVLVFYSSAIFWLLVQALFGAVASLKIHWPEFLGNSAWLTYGHMVPAQDNILVYGWASMAGIGTAIWLLSRLCRVPLPHPGVLVLAGLLWNVAVAAGVIGILAGDGRGFEYLEFSQRSMKLLFAAYALVAVWGVVLFLNRRPGHPYVTTSYMVASLLWFPWLLGIANVMLGRTEGVHGVMQAIVGAWYAQNLLGLWLGGLGLGAIYYLIPKAIGRPIHSYYLASFGFWTFAVFSVWTGLQRLNGGPVPAWMVTTSIVAAIMMVVPVTTVTVNFVATMRGSFDKVHESPTLCFVFYGAIAYTLANLVFLAGSFRMVSAVTQFTWFGVAEDQLFICAFFSMAMFGAIYYIVPRLLGREWLSSTAIKIHFWGVAYGYGASIVLLILAGIAQGKAQSVIQISDPTDLHADFLLSVSAMLPLLRGRSIAQLLVMAGELSFAIHFVLMLLRVGPLGVPESQLPIREEGGTKP